MNQPLESTVTPAAFDPAPLAARVKASSRGQNEIERDATLPKGTLGHLLLKRNTNPKIATLRALAKQLGCSVAELTGEADLRPATNGAGDADGFVLLRHHELRPSEANPREIFDEAEIAALAASIRGRGGVLQPLVIGATVDATGARPINMGERRWRAVGRLIEAGDWPSDRGLPCVTRDDFDAAEVLADALVENAQRVDLPPLDEARAYHRLHHEFKWTTARIAGAIGKTQRLVQIRLELVEKLAEPVQQALAEDRITLAAARVLTMAPETKQIEAARAIERGDVGYHNAENLKRNLLNALIPLGRNAFKLEQWTGELVADPDDPDKRYFDDRAQFLRLQRAAATAKVAELEKDWPWVILDDETDEDNDFDSWDFVDEDRVAKDTGAIVNIDFDDLSIQVFTHRVDGRAERAAEPTRPSTSVTPAPKPDGPAITKTHMIRARNVKTCALQQAVADNPGAGLRIVVLGLMGAPAVKLAIEDRWRRGPDDKADWPGLARIRMVLVKPLREAGVLDPMGSSAGTPDLDRLHRNPDFQAAAWNVLCDMPDDQVMALLAVLVAPAVGSWNGYETGLGDAPVPLAIARSLGLHMASFIAKEGVIDEDFLKSCRKPQLLALARWADARHDLKDITQTELRTLILAEVKGGGLKGHVPPTLAFGTPAEIAAMTKGEG